MITGEELIAAERTRQVEVEGWTAEHDDEHGGRVLWEAAECYEAGATAGLVYLPIGGGEPSAVTGLRWPWEAEAWKPGTAPRNLIRAGALYLAAAECFRRTGDDRPNKRWPLATGQTEADYVAWVLWLADMCDAGSRRIASRLDEWLAFAVQLLDPSITLDDRLSHYLAERQHTLSTAELPHLERIRAEARYVRGEANELVDAADALDGGIRRGGLRAVSPLFLAVRREVADVVLSATAAARDLGATVEDCIAEKALADRGRG